MSYSAGTKTSHKHMLKPILTLIALTLFLACSAIYVHVKLIKYIAGPSCSCNQNK